VRPQVVTLYLCMHKRFVRPTVVLLRSLIGDSKSDGAWGEVTAPFSAVPPITLAIAYWGIEGHGG
jgi:hypothetical protein